MRHSAALPFPILSMGRVQKIRAPFPAPHQHLLLLQALELFVVELRSAALVRGEIAGHSGTTPGRGRRSCSPTS